MKKFQILRYIKKLRYLIVLITILGCLATYFYVDRSQKYSAEIIIQYTNPTAKYGTAPDGSTINPKDIYSASVITDVKKELKLPENIDKIRSACSVEEVISEDDKKRKDALLEDGEEFDEICTTYKVILRAGSTSNEEYVKNVLDSIMNNYYIFYSQKYIDSAVIPNNSLNISADKYDYLECIEILESSIDDINEYLTNKIAYYPSFRSARTGYTFYDLQRKYNYIKNNTISEYYAIVLGERLTNNKEELLATYNNRLDLDKINVVNLDDHIDKQRSLIDQFGDKVTKTDSLVAGAVGDNTDAIIKDVDDYHHNKKNYIDVETTYDDLINHYVSLKSQKNVTEIDIDYCTEILGVFDDNGVKNSINTKKTKELVKDMNETIEELNELYAILEETSKEQCEHSAASNIKALTGIYVKAELNEKLYLLLALVLFFVVGCAGSVVIGRAVDFWEYIVYVDKKTGLPNRVRCDMVIDEYANGILPDSFSCVVLRLTNLNDTNDKKGRRAGDIMLRQFGDLIGSASKEYGFVGYNGGNIFIAFFENCSKERAENFVKITLENLPTSEVEFDVSYGIAETSTSNVYEVRKLLQKGFSDLYN